MTNHPWTWRPFILWAKKGEVMASIRVDATFPGGAVENVEHLWIIVLKAFGISSV